MAPIPSRVSVTIDRQQFMKQGYLILRGLIPPELLEAVRDCFEQLVRREWPDGPNPGRPPWQPRIFDFDNLVDETSAGALEFCMHDHIMETTRQLMQVEDVGLAYLYFMRNPVKDYGPWFWHRDFSHYHGPLQGMQRDFVENGPNHLQWNIALYDDDVFWVVPGSHIRPNTEAENTQMAAVPHSYAQREPPPDAKRHTPLPDSIPVELTAGDSVVYSNMLLHWGSNYSTKHRRCIHIGTRGFGARRFFYDFCSGDNVSPHLSPAKRAEHERARQLYREEQECVESTFRAIIDRDEPAFRQGLAQLHPPENGRLSCLIQLDIIVRHMQERPDPRFSPEETARLWQRFASLEEALKVEGGDYVPGFQLRERIPYRVYEMPEGYDLDSFVKGWN